MMFPSPSLTPLLRRLFWFFTTGVAALHAENLTTKLAIDDVVERHSLTGEGVLVAHIGEGVDFQHPTFVNPDGTSRILSYFDLTDNQGANDADNPLGIGTLYTQAEINAALESDSALGPQDGFGASTAQAGAIAGGPVGAFEGIAPRAHLLVLQTTNLGLPGNEAATEQYNPSLLPAAAQYVLLRSAELGMPAVVYLDDSVQGGPTDGTSALAEIVDAFSGPGHPGIVFVTSPGETRGISNAVARSIAPGESVDFEIVKRQEETLVVDLWYPSRDASNAPLPPLSVSLTTPGGQTYGPYTPASNEAFITDRQEPGVFSILHRSEAFDVFQASGTDREILTRLVGADGVYTLSLSLPESASEPVPLQATLDASYRFGDNPSGFQQENSRGIVWDGAASDAILAVTGYALGSDWTDIDGNARSDDPALGAQGAIETRANVGPTFDGRYPIDLAAPAGSLVAPVPSYATLASDRSRLVAEAPGPLAAVRGNSMAAAVAAGMVALMLDADPELDASDIRAILQTTAIEDAFTEATPNATWGAGKLDPAAALELSTVYRARRQPPRMTLVPDAGLLITVATESGLTYQLQRSSSLEAGAWEDLGDPIQGDGAARSVAVPSPDSSADRAFFRFAVRP